MKKGVIFYGLVGFWENRKRILDVYSGMNIDEIEIYKMFVYSLPFMDDNIKDLIWDYLNGSYETNFILSGEYRKAKEKLEKRKKNCIELGADNEWTNDNF